MRTKTPETKAKIAAGMKAAWANHKFADRATHAFKSAGSLARSISNLRNSDSAVQSRRARKRLTDEEAEADKLREQGYEVFSPTVVCDRVAVKDGKVYFVEFKPVGQSLRAGQQRICDLVPEQYLVIYN